MKTAFGMGIMKLECVCLLMLRAMMFPWNTATLPVYATVEMRM